MTYVCFFVFMPWWMYRCMYTDIFKILRICFIARTDMVCSGGIQPNISWYFLVIWKCLYHCDPAAQDLEEFWSHEATTEWFRRHPILQVTWRGLPHKCHRGARYMSSVYIKVTDPRGEIPLRFFGDGAESYSPLSKNHATNKHWLYPCWSLSHGWHPVQGKHKFEILTLVLPLAKSSSTMDNRILSHGLSRCFCQWPNSQQNSFVGSTHC